MIQVNMMCWNNEERIGLALRSVHDYVDKIVVIDGAYEGFAPNMPVESIDHTRVIAEAFPKVEFIQLHERLRPPVKRMLAFEEHEADWYIVLDTDEVMFGDMNRMIHVLKTEKPVHGYKVFSYLNLRGFISKTTFAFARIIHKSAGFRYQPNHWQRHDKDGKNMDDYCQLIPAEVVVLQMNELCPEWRKKAKSAWVSWRQSRGEGW